MTNSFPFSNLLNDMILEKSESTIFSFIEVIYFTGTFPMNEAHSEYVLGGPIIYEHFDRA